MTLEEILTEKRLEFRSNLNLLIEGDFSQTYGIFSEFNPTELKTIISNCINNSIEAFPQKKGTVKLELEESGSLVQIFIKDNGCGIPTSIISKIGLEGFSHGKEKNTKSGNTITISNIKAKRVDTKNTKERQLDPLVLEIK